MKMTAKIFIAILCLSAAISPVRAADVPIPKPTAKELQARVDFLTAALQGARQQRDAALSALADAQLQASLSEQRKPSPKE